MKFYIRRKCKKKSSKNERCKVFSAYCIYTEKETKEGKTTKRKKYRFPTGFMVSVVGISSILALTGCEKQYDVLDKIADSTTVGESISDKVQDELDIESSNAEYIIKRLAAVVNDSNTNGSDSDTDSEIGERPEYDPIKYVDVSGCDISKTAEEQNMDISEEDIDDAVKEEMMNQNIFSKKEKSESGDIVTIDYTATEKGQKKAFVDVKDEDRIVGDNLFPDEVDKKLVGVKAGDVIDVEYSFPEDYKDETYKGKTFDYHITIEKVKGLTLTDETAVSLSGGAQTTAKEYREYIKSLLEYKKTQELSESGVDALCENAKITKYPDDVLSYDVQQAFIQVYQASGVSDINSDAFKSYVKSIGYDSIGDFTQKVQETATKELETEMKVLALAKTYDLWLDDKTLSKEILNQVTGYSSAEDYYADYSKYHAQYVMARINIAKEMQKNGKQTKRAG